MTLTNKDIVKKVEKLLLDPDTKITIKNKSFGPSQKLRKTQYGMDNSLNPSDEKAARIQIGKYNNSDESGLSILLSADESFLKSNIFFLDDLYNKTLDTTQSPKLFTSKYWPDLLIQLDLNQTDFDEKKLVFSRATLVLPTIFFADIDMKIKTTMEQMEKLLALQPSLFEQKFVNEPAVSGTYPKVSGFESINRQEHYNRSVSSSFISIHTTDSVASKLEIFSRTMLAFVFDYILSRYDLHFNNEGQIRILPMVENDTQNPSKTIPVRIKEIDDVLKPYIDKPISKFLSDTYSFDNNTTLSHVVQSLFPSFLSVYSDKPAYSQYSYYSNYDEYVKIAHLFEYGQLDSTTNSDLEKIDHLFHQSQSLSNNSSCISYKEEHMNLLNKSQTNNPLQTDSTNHFEVKTLFQFDINSEKTFDVIEHTQYKNTATLLAQLEDMSYMNRSRLRNKKLLITDDGIIALQLSHYNNNKLTMTLF